jgi:hypothetical protein
LSPARSRVGWRLSAAPARSASAAVRPPGARSVPSDRFRSVVDAIAASAGVRTGGLAAREPLDDFSRHARRPLPDACAVGAGSASLWPRATAQDASV